MSGKPCLLFPFSFLALYENLSFPDAQFLSHNRLPHRLSAVRSRSRQRNLGLGAGGKQSNRIYLFPSESGYRKKIGGYTEWWLQCFKKKGKRIVGRRKKVLAICTGL
jgi:hypothetical protein